MRRRLLTVTYGLSLVLCVVTVVLWVVPVRPWPNHGRGAFFFSVEKHQVLRVNIFRTISSPVVSPPQENTRAFVAWQVAIPAGPSFEFLGFRVAYYPWFKGSKSADGHQFLTHVGTHWSFDVPFLGLFLLFAMPLVAKLSVLAWRRSVRVAGYCIKCEYDLTGNTSGVCPECGTAIKVS